MADLPEERQRHDQALLAGFLEESPWNLKQVVPSDWCVWITGLPPSVVKRATSLKGAERAPKMERKMGQREVNGSRVDPAGAGGGSVSWAEEYGL